MTSPTRRAAATADARSRARRTLAQGLALDVTAAVLAAAATAVGDVRWTRASWAVFGALLVKTALQSAAAYLHRRVMPPS